MADKDKGSVAVSDTKSLEMERMVSCPIAPLQEVNANTPEEAVLVEQSRNDEQPLRGSVVAGVKDGVTSQSQNCSANPEMKSDSEEQCDVSPQFNSETEARPKITTFNSKNHASLTNVHGIGFHLVPEYLRTNKIESGYSNVQTMELILSSEATMEYNEESANFQPMLNCQLAGLQPKGIRQQRILPGPVTVLRDEVLYLPHNNKYRRAALNVEIKPNVDALDSPIPIKLIKANTFYDKYARVHLSNRTADRWYSYTRGHGSLRAAGYFTNAYHNSRNRSHSKVHETTTSRWLRPLTPSVRYLYGSTGSLSEVSRRKTDLHWLPIWRTDRYHDQFITNQRMVDNSETRKVKADTVSERTEHRTNRNYLQQDSTPKKWSTKTIETVTEKNPPEPVENRWSTTTVETITEKRPPKPVEDRWNMTTVETFTEKGPPKPVGRWNTTTVDTVTEKRPLEPVQNRWNTTTVETITEKGPPKPVENRWNSTTIETFTE